MSKLNNRIVEALNSAGRYSGNRASISHCTLDLYALRMVKDEGDPIKSHSPWYANFDKTKLLHTKDADLIECSTGIPTYITFDKKDAQILRKLVNSLMKNGDKYRVEKITFMYIRSIGSVLGVAE